MLPLKQLCGVFTNTELTSKTHFRRSIFIFFSQKTIINYYKIIKEGFDLV